MTSKQVEKLDNFSKMKSWDSLAHLEILSALDAKLNKLYDLREIYTNPGISGLMKIIGE